MPCSESNGCWIKAFICNLWDLIAGYGVYFINPFKKIENPSKDTINGKTVLITGATHGIGRSAAIELAKRGAKLVLACRNMDLSNQLAQQIESLTGGKVLTVYLDLTSLESVKQCATTVKESIDRLDILINNAGIAGDSTRNVTIDGFEQVMQVNHYGSWLLTHLLLPLVRSSSPSRIIFTASSTHRFVYKLDLDNLNSDKGPYSHHAAYSKSKLANILTTLHLSSTLKDSGVTVNSFCPGPVDTSIIDDLLGPIFNFLARPLKSLFIRTTEQGAQTLIYLAVDKSLDSVTGKHFVDCKPIATNRLGDDFDLSVKLWQTTERLLDNYLK